MRSISAAAASSSSSATRSEPARRRQAAGFPARPSTPTNAAPGTRCRRARVPGFACASKASTSAPPARCACEHAVRRVRPARTTGDSTAPISGRSELLVQRAPHLQLEDDPSLSTIDRQLSAELQRNGIRRGPALRLVFENLDDFVSPRETRAFLWNEVAARFREAASAKCVDPGPGHRGREGLLKAPRRTPQARRFDTRAWRGRPRKVGLLQQDHEWKPRTQRSRQVRL